MKYFNFSPGIIIAMLGFCGLVFSLIDDSGEIGSKIPLAVFFLIIISIGIIFEMRKDTIEQTYGEFEGSGRKYG